MNGRIDVGRVVEEVFGIYRDQAGVLLPAALVVFVLEGIISGVLIAISFALVLVALIVQIVATTLYQGMVVQLVADVQDGRRDASVETLLRSVSGAIVPLILTGLLAGIGIAIGFILLIVPGLFLLTIWSVAAPVVVLERPGVTAALGRSRELVRGHGWQVFGTIVLFFLILVVVSAIISGIGAAAGDAGRVIADIVSSVLVAPLIALAASVLYFQLRAAKGETGVPGHAVGLEATQPAAPPAAPGGPAGPEAPGQPAGPATPGQPAGPETPGQPGAPGQGPEAPPPQGQEPPTPPQQ